MSLSVHFIRFSSTKRPGNIARPFPSVQRSTSPKQSILSRGHWKFTKPLSDTASTTRWFSSWPFYPLIGGHCDPLKGHLTIPKRPLWITRKRSHGFLFTSKKCSGSDAPIHTDKRVNYVWVVKTGAAQVPFFGVDNLFMAPSFPRFEPS